MENKNRILAIIPARSGSKGLVNKNIRELNGKPLLAYSIQAAQESNICDTIHVSTDSEEYSQIAKDYGADQQFLRDATNSGDTASTWDAVKEVIRKYEQLGEEFDVCILLQPTSPLREASDITAAYELYVQKDATSVVSVTEVEHPIQWSFTLDDSVAMKDFASSPYKNCRRQELEKHYRENGAVYIVDIKSLMSQEFDFYSDACYAYVMDARKSIDIDSLTDFKIAEILMKEGTDVD